MLDFRNFFKHKASKDIVTSLPQTITFEYARTNPGTKVMDRSRDTGLLTPIKSVEPFTGFKAATIRDVKRIYTGPENTQITIKNVVAFIEEPCIPAFLKLQGLGIQTDWSSADSHNGEALLSIMMRTLSEENKDIAISNKLYNGYGLDLTFPIELTDTVQAVSNKLLELCSVFVSQPVLYGHQSQTEFLNDYSKYNNPYIAEISNIDPNYIRDHINYLLANFPQYITFNESREAKYKCINMPDDLFQREVLDRELSCRIFFAEPQVCINGIVWASRELYNINEHNTKQRSNTLDSDIKGHDIQHEEHVQNSLEDIDGTIGTR